MNPLVGNATPPSDKPATEQLSIAVIGPDESLRASLLDTLSCCRVGQVHDFLSYPPRVQDVNNLLELKSNIVMIELDSDHDYSIEIIRAVCAAGKSTVMVYSKMPDSEVPESELLMRCMQAGAREFLNLPFAADQLQESFERAALRHFGSPELKKPLGKMMVFCAAKGGAGATSIACNFAISLVKQSRQRVLLVDMDLPMGDVALNLGVRSRYSTSDALQNCDRVDSAFLSRLLTHHPCGLAVLPAPGRFPAYPATTGAMDRLLALARQDFDFVVVDAGSKFDLANVCAEYREASILYLITQAGIPELRNANQFLAHSLNLGIANVEVVLNRYESTAPDFSDADVSRALNHPVSWKIPNDFKAMRRMQDTSEPVVATDSSIARHVEAMVRTACGLAPEPSREKTSGLRRWFNLGEKKVVRVPESAHAETAHIVGAPVATTATHALDLPMGVACHDEERINPGRRSSSPWNY